MSESPYLTFLSDQVIPCHNDECVVEQFRLRVHLDATPNGKPKWSIDRVEPRCPSCNMSNHQTKGYVGPSVNL